MQNVGSVSGVTQFYVVYMYLIGLFKAYMNCIDDQTKCM